MPRGVFMTYVCDGVGSSAVDKGRQADFHFVEPELVWFIRVFFKRTDLEQQCQRVLRRAVRKKIIT